MNPFKNFSRKKNQQYNDDLVAIIKKATKMTQQTKKKVNFQEETIIKVIKIIKGDFENHYGISLEKFIQEYKDIMENYPEKLI